MKEPFPVLLWYLFFHMSNLPPLPFSEEWKSERPSHQRPDVKLQIATHSGAAEALPPSLCQTTGGGEQQESPPPPCKSSHLHGRERAWRLFLRRIPAVVFVMNQSDQIFLTCTDSRLMCSGVLFTQKISGRDKKGKW